MNILKNGLFVIAILSFSILSHASSEISYKLTYEPYPLNEYPRIGASGEHPWLLDKLIFEDRAADLKNDCHREDKLTVCSGVVRDVKFLNYKGINIQFGGYGILSMEFMVDELAYIKGTIEQSAVKNSNRIYFNKRVKSNTGNFPSEEGLRTYSIDEAPLIGGEIANKKTATSIKLACVETKNSSCKYFQIITASAQGRRLLNPYVFQLDKLPKLDKIKKSINYQGEWILPTTAATMACGVPLFLPITLPLDIVLLPVTFPIALLKKKHAQKALKNLFDLTNTKKISVNYANFEMLEDTLEYIRN